MKTIRDALLLTKKNEISVVIPQQASLSLKSAHVQLEPCVTICANEQQWRIPELSSQRHPELKRYRHLTVATVKNDKSFDEIFQLPVSRR